MATLPPGLIFLVSNIGSLVNIRLDSQNYMLWRLQMRNALRANSLLGYVDGTIPRPAPTILSSSSTSTTTTSKSSNPEFVSWNSINAHLISCFLGTLSPSVLAILPEFETTYEIWSFLAEQFSSLSRTHVHEIRSALMSIVKDSTMDSYLSRIKEYADRLSAIGDSLREEDLIFYTLKGLPHEYAAFCTNIRTRSTSISFNELISLLRVEEMHVSRTTPVLGNLESSPTALMTQFSNLNIGSPFNQGESSSMALAAQYNNRSYNNRQGSSSNGFRNGFQNTFQNGSSSNDFQNGFHPSSSNGFQTGSSNGFQNGFFNQGSK